MKRLTDLPFLVILLGIAALTMLLPAAHAAVDRQFHIARAFFYDSVVLLLLAGFIGMAMANRPPRFSARNHLSVLVGTYAVLPVALALPLLQSVPGITLWQAWFEMLSAFTTTGATLFAPEALAPTLHLWRALVGWLGGFYILVMAMAVLAPLNLGGVEVATGRNPGRDTTLATPIKRIADPAQRITYYALMLLPAYGGLTLALWVGLLMAGETGLVALCHAMATLSTSGISPIGGLDGSASGRVGEVLIAVFLLAAVSRRLLPVLSGLERPILAYDPELRSAGVILLVVVLAIFAMQGIGAVEAMQAEAALHIVWGALFTGLSFLTTTGFVSPDWTGSQVWSGLHTPGLVLLSLALIGGGVATTAGGVKLLRVYALFRHGQNELERLIEPSLVGGRGQDARQMRGEGAYLAWIFFVLFAMSIGGVTALLTLCAMDIEPALVFALSALTNTGPLSLIAMPQPVEWATLDPVPQAVLAAAMVLGRLETLAVLAFLAPDSWRR